MKNTSLNVKPYLLPYKTKYCDKNYFLKIYFRVTTENKINKVNTKKMNLPSIQIFEEYIEQSHQINVTIIKLVMRQLKEFASHLVALKQPLGFFQT